MLASITLLPAVLGFVGRNIDQLLGRRRTSRRPQPREQRSGSGGAASCSAARGPRSLGGARASCSCSRSRSSRCGSASPTPAATRQSDTTRQAYDLVAEGFGPGFNGPLILAAEFPDGQRRRAALDAIVGRRARHARRRRGRQPPDAQPVGRRRGHPGDPDDLAAAAQTDRRWCARLRDDVIPAARRGHRRARSTSAALTAVGHRRLRPPVVAAADLHRRGARAELPPAAGGVPQRPRAAQGRDHEPAVDRRGLRRRRRGVPVGLVRQRDRRRARPGRSSRSSR